MFLDEKQLQEVENYGAVGYPPEIVARNLEVDIQLFILEFNDNTSEVYRRYHKGLQEARYTVELALLKKAQSGDHQAVKAYEKYKRDKELDDFIHFLDELD